MDTALPGLHQVVGIYSFQAVYSEGEAMGTKNTGLSYGCLFCRSGSEDRIIGDLQYSHPFVQCISPKRIRVRRQGEKNLDTLMPGYIFFKTETDIDFRSILNKEDVYRLLKYPTGDWKLNETDLQIAQMMFEMGGIVGLSKAVFEGDTVRIIDGPMKIYENHITKFDKRAKTAQVQFDFQGKLVTIWLGFVIEESGFV